MVEVRWVRSALEDLAAIWLDSSSVERSAITAASHQIDERLRSNPEDEGESRSGNRRILLVPPLGITFVVSANKHLVRVLDVWWFEARR